MESPLQSPIKLTVIYSILISLVSITLTMIFYMTQRFGDLWTGYISSGVLFVGVMVFVVHVNKVLGGGASLRSLLLYGLIVTAICVVVLTSATILFHLATEPPAGATRGNVPSDGTQISEYSVYKRDGFWIFLLGNVTGTHAVLGALGAFLGAVTVKRNQKTPDAR